jgi:hypothetical protein
MFYALSEYEVRYVSWFISISSPDAYGVILNLSAWESNSSEPYKQKASITGLGSMEGSIGSLLGVFGDFFFLFVFVKLYLCASKTIIHVFSCLRL